MGVKSAAIVSGAEHEGEAWGAWPPDHSVIARRWAGQEQLKRLGGFNAATACPIDELNQIDTAVRCLAVVNPALRLPQPFPQVTLRQARRLTQGAEEARQRPVSSRVLRLGRHATRLSGQPALTLVQCQTYNLGVVVPRPPRRRDRRGLLRAFGPPAQRVRRMPWPVPRSPSWARRDVMSRR